MNDRTLMETIQELEQANADGLRELAESQAEVERLKEHLLKAGEQEIRLHGEVDRLEKSRGEENVLKASIQFWSYCTWQGMLYTCPEKEESLRYFLTKQHVAPWKFSEITEGDDGK